MADIGTSDADHLNSTGLRMSLSKFVRRKFHRQAILPNIFDRLIERLQSGLANLIAELQRRPDTAVNAAAAAATTTTNKNENTAFRITTRTEDDYTLAYNAKHCNHTKKLLPPTFSILTSPRVPVPPAPQTLKHSTILSTPTQGRMATIRHPSIVSLTLPNVVTEEPMCHAPIQVPPGLLPPMNIVPHPAVCPKNHVLYAAKATTTSPSSHHVNCRLPHSCGLPLQQHVNAQSPQPQQPPSISTSAPAPAAQRSPTIKLGGESTDENQASSRVLIPVEQASLQKAGVPNSVCHTGHSPCDLKSTAILAAPAPTNPPFPANAARGPGAADPDLSPPGSSLNLTERFLRWLHIGCHPCAADTAQDLVTASPTRSPYVDNKVCRRLAAGNPRSTANQMDVRRRCRSQPPRHNARGGQRKPVPPTRQQSPQCGQVALESQRLPAATAALAENHRKWSRTNGIVTSLPHYPIPPENTASRDLTAVCTALSCPSGKSVRSTAEPSAIAPHNISVSTGEDFRSGNGGRLRRWFFPSPSSSNSHQVGNKSRRKAVVEEAHSLCMNDLHYRDGVSRCVPVCLVQDSSFARDTTVPPPPPPRMLLTKIGAASAAKPVTAAATRSVEVQTCLPLCSCQSKSEESFCPRETTVGRDQANLIDCERVGESGCGFTPCKCHSAYTTYCCPDGNGPSGLSYPHNSCSVAFDCPCFSWVGDMQPALSPTVVDHHLLLHHYHYHHYYSHDCGIPPDCGDIAAAVTSVHKRTEATGEFSSTVDQVTTSSPSRPASPLIKLSLSWPPPADGSGGGGGGVTETIPTVEPPQQPDDLTAVPSTPRTIESAKVLITTAPSAASFPASTPVSDSTPVSPSNHEATELIPNVPYVQTSVSEVSTAVKAPPLESPRASHSSSRREQFEMTSVPSAESVAEQRKLDQRRAFLQNMNQLKRTGWYWGPLTIDEAERLLMNRQDGSFLVRDSGHELYILSLSFRAQNRIYHTRIEHSGGKFSFSVQGDTETTSTSIAQFINHVIADSARGRTRFFLRQSILSPPMGARVADPQGGTQEQQAGVEEEQNETRHVEARLLYPVSRFMIVQSLAHLCRFEILLRVRRDHIEKLPIPKRLQEYLQERQYYTEFIQNYLNSVNPTTKCPALSATV
nr:unnamed protein product [Spirometra erinaceieuropaei]